MARTPVLHADADCFAASIIMRDHPELRHVPFAAVAHVYIASANCPARARGVRGGMLRDEALRICPELVTEATSVEIMRAEGEALFDVFHDVARAVEPGSAEEAFLGVGDVGWQEAGLIAAELRRRVSRELGLPLSVGIGSTKLMAKLASRAAKPDGVHVIGPHEETRLRSQVRLSDVWGVGARTIQKLEPLGVRILADVDSVDPTELRIVAGPAMAALLGRIRTGTDDAVVRPVEHRRRMTAEGAVAGFGRADLTPDALLDSLVRRVCRRAQRAGLAAGSLRLTLGFPGPPVGAVREERIDEPSAQAERWLPRARLLLSDLPAAGATRITVSLSELVPASSVQGLLF